MQLLFGPTMPSVFFCFFFLSLSNVASMTHATSLEYSSLFVRLLYQFFELLVERLSLVAHGKTKMTCFSSPRRTIVFRNSEYLRDSAQVIARLLFDLLIFSTFVTSQEIGWFHPP